MKTIFEYWWDNGNKVFDVINFAKPWKQNNIKPKLSFKTNGAKKSKGDKWLDVSLTVGYIVFNYVNFNLQGKRKEDK